MVTAIATDAAGNSSTDLNDADGRYHRADGCDHHHRGRRQSHQCVGSNWWDPGQRHGGDRLDPDGERFGGDGGWHRSLDDVDYACRPGCAGGDGGGDRRGWNSSTATTNLTVDTIAPTVAITTIEGGDNLINATEAAGGIQISGTAEIGSTLTVNGSAVTVDGTGHWTTSLTPAGQGTLVVTAVATDAAGNSSTATTNLTVDNKTPTC